MAIQRIMETSALMIPFDEIFYILKIIPKHLILTTRKFATMEIY